MSRVQVMSAAVASAAMLVSLAGTASAVTAQPPGDAGEVVSSYAVAGPGTVAGAPTDHYSDAAGAQQVFAPAAVNLPFDFTFDVQYSLNSRDFFPANGRACVNAAVTGGQGEKMSVELYDFLQKGPTVNWNTNGSVQQYCFTGLDNGEDYYFRITHVSGGPAVSGYGSVTG
ncbi:hypothetical protein OG943_38995 [Amycolatopsis sp. NBC_00345]|uniref:hypothetical protein n=1 Tax=Amycolatopsis sp. NBC_00345 TaxID=2975955 RepID=UPI002E271041